MSDERDGLIRYLAMQRDLVRIAAFGLTDEQARLAPSASPLSVGGLIKHPASTETNWVDMIAGVKESAAGDGDVHKASTHKASTEYGDDFLIREDETLDSLLQRYADVAARTEAVVDGATAYELMATAEGWPAPDWLSPWASGEVCAASPGGVTPVDRTRRGWLGAADRRQPVHPVDGRRVTSDVAGRGSSARMAMMIASIHSPSQRKASRRRPSTWKPHFS